MHAQEKWSASSGRIFAAAVFFLASQSLGAAESPTSLCSRFNDHLNKPERLWSYVLQGKPTDDGNIIEGVDFDDDGVADRIDTHCWDSANIIPPDPCKLGATSSASGEPLGLVAQRLYLIDFESHTYVVSGDMDSEDGPVHTLMQRLTKNGLVRECAYECSLSSACQPAQ